MTKVQLLHDLMKELKSYMRSRNCQRINMDNLSISMEGTDDDRFRYYVYNESGSIIFLPSLSFCSIFSDSKKMDIYNCHKHMVLSDNYVVHNSLVPKSEVHDDYKYFNTSLLYSFNPEEMELLEVVNTYLPSSPLVILDMEKFNEYYQYKIENAQRCI